LVNGLSDINFFKITILLYCFFALIITLAFHDLATYIFSINFIISIILSLSGRWIDIRVGMLVFLSLYYFGQFFNFFVVNSNDVASGLNDNIAFHLQDYTINIQALNYVVFFQLGLLVNLTLHAFNFHKITMSQYGKSSILTYDYFIMSKITKALLLFVFVLLLTTLNWDRISNEYTLEGMSKVFFVYYLLFTVIVINFIYKSIYLKKGRSQFVVFMLLSIILFNYLGVRQVLFWSLLVSFISIAIFIHIYKNTTLSFVRYKKYFFFFLVLSIFLLILLNISFLFRHQKSEVISVLLGVNFMDMVNSLISAFFAETKLTTYNLLAIVSENNQANYLSFFGMLSDMLIMMIPYDLWAEKYAYLETVNFAKKYNVTPFGTWYIVGHFASLAVYPIFVFIASYMYSMFLYVFSAQVLTRCNSLIMASVFYGISYVFLGLYVVRGSLIGGIKMTLTLIFGIMLLNFILKYVRLFLIKTS